MAPRDEQPLWPYYIGALFIFAVIAYTLNSLRNLTEPNSTQTATPQIEQAPTPIIVATVSPASDLVVKNGKTKLYCLNGNDVDYSVLELIPSGGKLPYRVEIQNSRFELQSSFTMDRENIPFIVQVYGGETIIVKIWSLDSLIPDWDGKITIPENDRYCENAPTATSTPIFTATTTSTETPTSVHKSLTATSTRTKNSNPSIATQTPTPTSTPTIMVEETHVPTSTDVTINASPTDSPKPTSTPTNEPDPTNAPTFTSPPTVAPTNTPVIVPRLKDCGDGIDNDNDQLIDFPNDPQCDSKDDNREDK
jgi:hypothetical protein